MNTMCSMEIVLWWSLFCGAVDWGLAGAACKRPGDGGPLMQSNWLYCVLLICRHDLKFKLSHSSDTSAVVSDIWFSPSCADVLRTVRKTDGDKGRRHFKERLCCIWSICKSSGLRTQIHYRETVYILTFWQLNVWKLKRLPFQQFLAPVSMRMITAV